MAKAGQKIKEVGEKLKEKLFSPRKETPKNESKIDLPNELVPKDGEGIRDQGHEMAKEGYEGQSNFDKKAPQEMTESGFRTQKLLSEQEEEAARARDTAAAEEDAARKAAYQAAINTGANRAAASAISSAGDTRGLQSNAASALRNAATSTQADYLTKMGYVEGLQSNLDNTKAGSFLNILSGIGQGILSGAGTGASIGGFIPF